ncbi:YopJ family acetyltransferase [Uliginosibacterium gangwonense]|uniref:YopJ family acetyltransferase n=1 Tax=Uliginosibacterium gangwonense TaxID=392736 RepID=UPI0003A1BFB7|nr:YopJ family acetyltransferase [Uliginosibacterium gangwonense]
MKSFFKSIIGASSGSRHETRSEHRDEPNREDAAWNRPSSTGALQGLQQWRTSSPANSPGRTNLPYTTLPESNYSPSAYGIGNYYQGYENYAGHSDASYGSYAGYPEISYEGYVGYPGASYSGSHNQSCDGDELASRLSSLPVYSPSLETASSSRQVEHPTASAHGQSTRADAVKYMQQVKERFQMLLHGNWSPAAVDDKYDEAVFHVLVAAENARSPTMNLQLLDSGDDLASWLQRERTKTARVISVMRGLEPHVVTADIRRIDGKTSVVVIEPLGMSGDTRRKYEQEALPSLRSTLPSDVTMSILSLNIQKSTNDCRIFALSAASKLDDYPDLILKHHQKNIKGKSLKTANGHKAGVLAGSGNVRVIDGVGVVPPVFAKHTQSRKTLDNWLRASPRSYGRARVNKNHQSIMERYGSYVTTRYEAPINARFMIDNLPELGGEMPIRSLVFSQSIEEKRLTYLDRAIEYLKRAPAEECSRFLERMTAHENAPSNPSSLHLDDRDWGPHPDTL